MAAIGVVLSHTHNVAAGRAGVDLFFMISGFVMLTATGKSFRPINFLAARAWRVLPLWWLASLCFLAAVTFAAHGNPVANPHFLMSADQFVANLALIPKYAVENNRWSAYAVGWTLQYEMLFYVLFAACLCARSWALSVVLLFAMATAWAFGARFVYFNPVVVEFGVGILMARHLRRPPIWMAAFLPVGVVLIAPVDAIPAYSPRRIVEYGVPAAMVLIGSLALEPVLPRLRALHFLGSASYSIYLFHMFAVFALGDMVGYGPSAAAMILGVALGCCVHVVAERPLAGLGKTILQAPILSNRGLTRR